MSDLSPLYKPDIVEENDGKERSNVVELKLATGGNGPTDYHPNDWLSPMPDGAVFLFIDKQSNESNLGQCKILSRTEKAVYLGFIIGNNTTQGPVDPIRFCKRYSKYEDLGVLTDAQQEEQLDEPSAKEAPNDGDRV